MVHFRSETGCRPRLTVALVAVTVAVAARPAQGRQVLFISNYDSSTVGEYSAVSGATINAGFVNRQGSTPGPLAVDVNNHLFVGFNDGTVGEYDTRNGATVGSFPVTNDVGTSAPTALTVAANGTLFVGKYGGGRGATIGIVAEYNAASLALINQYLIIGTGTQGYFGALTTDNSNHLYVVELSNGIVGVFNATTGAAIGGASLSPAFGTRGMALDALGHLFVTDTNGSSIGAVTGFDTTGSDPFYDYSIFGLANPLGLALDGNNHLFVVNNGNGTVGEYDATTGATINANFITGLGSGANAIVFAPVPEPSSLLLVAAAASAAICRRRFIRR